MGDDFDFDADDHDEERRLAIAERVLRELHARADNVQAAFWLGEVVRIVAREKARVARKAASVA